MSPDDAPTIYCAIMAIKHFPCGATVLVPGDFNADLAAPEGDV